jgi:ribosome-associated heat shock protein Hsp15
VRLPLADNPALMTRTHPDRMRLDKWLWAARFYKTRSLAADEIGKGRISVNGQAAKAARELRVGDRLRLRQGPVTRMVRVLGLSAVRGPAPVAQALYEETAESIAAREAAAAQRRLGVEPADACSRAARPSATGASWPTGTAGAPASTTRLTRPAAPAAPERKIPS